VKIYEKQINGLFALIETSTGVDLHPLFQQFQRDLALGLFPIPGHKTGVAFVGYVKSESDTEHFLEHNVDPNLKRRLPDLQKSGLTYNGTTYYRYNSSHFPEGIAPAYAVINHHLLLAYSEESLKILLDVKKGTVGALKKSEVFQSAKKRISFKRG